MKVGEYKTFDKYDVARLGLGLIEMFSDVEYFLEEINSPETLMCTTFSGKWNPSMTKLKIAEKSRTIDTVKVFTCDLCCRTLLLRRFSDSDAPNDTTFG